MLPEVRPTHVARQSNRLAKLVQRRKSNVATTSNIDGREIQRLTQQSLVHRRRQQFVDLVHLLVRHSHRDSGGSLLGKQRRIQERLLQRHAHHLAGDAACGVHEIDGFSHRRVAKAEGCLRVLEGNRGVFAAVIAHEFR